jgi:hypothetical protein
LTNSHCAPTVCAHRPTLLITTPSQSQKNARFASDYYTVEVKLHLGATSLTPDTASRCFISELLDLLAGLDQTTAVHTSDEFPFILAAGQRRAFTANTIFRDTGWRLRDRDEKSMEDLLTQSDATVSAITPPPRPPARRWARPTWTARRPPDQPWDAQRFGLDNGAEAQITTSRGTARATVEIDDRLRNAALPNGFGLEA